MNVMPLIAAALMSIAAPDGSAPSEPRPALKAAADGDRVQCRSVMITGSRFERRICKKAKDWDAIAVRSREDFKESQDKTWVCIRPEGGGAC